MNSLKLKEESHFEDKNFISGKATKNIYAHFLINHVKTKIAMPAMNKAKSYRGFMGVISRGQSKTEKELLYILNLNEGEKEIYRYLKMNKKLRIITEDECFEFEQNKPESEGDYSKLFDIMETEDYFAVHGAFLMKVPASFVHNISTKKKALRRLP